MCDSASASRRRHAAGEFTNSVEPAGRISVLARRTHVFVLSLACLAVWPSQVQAQEAPDRQEELGRFVLEAGIVEGSSGCPGHYVGINGQVAGPVSLYGRAEYSRCADQARSASRCSPAIGKGQEDDVAAVSFDEDPDGRASQLAKDQVPFPVARPGSVRGLGRSLGDRDHVLEPPLARSVPRGSSSRTACAPIRREFLSKRTACLHV